MKPKVNKEGNNKDISEIKNRKTIEKINQTKTRLFEKNKIEKNLGGYRKKKDSSYRHHESRRDHY